MTRCIDCGGHIGTANPLFGGGTPAGTRCLSCLREDAHARPTKVTIVRGKVVFR